MPPPKAPAKKKRHRRPQPTTMLTDFATQTKKRCGGVRSRLDSNATATADVMAFAQLKAAGETDASWAQFSIWLKQTHGISLRPNSLFTWAKNRSAV